MLLFTSIIDTKREAYINFNTSNVTIYPAPVQMVNGKVKFQYI